MSNLEGLQKKIGRVTKDLVILNNNLNKLTDELKKFGIAFGQAGEHLRKIEKEDAQIAKKIDGLHTEADVILEGLER